MSQTDAATPDQDGAAQPAPSPIEVAIGELLQVFMQLAGDIDDAAVGVAADAALVRLDAVMAGAA